MNVKRYIAPNIQEAMIKIKRELGSDAIILHTRKIRQKGLKGLFKKTLIEVVAAVDKVEDVNRIEVPKNEIDNIKQNVSKSYIENKIIPVKELEIDNSKIKVLEKDMSEIKELLNKMLVNDNNVKEKVPEVSVVKNISKDDTNKIEQKIEEGIKKDLLDCDIKEALIDKIIEVVKRQVSLSDSNDHIIKATVKQAIKDYIGEPFVIDHFIGKQRVFLFVGPTGVGKTTTLAKLAAKLSLVENKKVAFVTADTYRIAAVEQLKTYSEILGIPLSVIYESSELEDVMYKYKDKDVILLDTAGRSHKSPELSKDLKELLVNIENPEIFLVISLTTAYKDILSILEAYKFLDEYRLIFTKLDEASSFSNILNIKAESGKELSYLTTGQSVPDDIEVADAERITNYIVGEFNDRSSV